MPEQQIPLTYEAIMNMFRETGRRIEQLAEERRMDIEARRAEAEERRIESEERRIEAKERRAHYERQLQEAKVEWQEASVRWKELERLSKATDKKIAALGDRIGEIVEHMIGGDIINQFQELGYSITAYSRDKIFAVPDTNEHGEVDLLLEDGIVTILIEVKTNLKTEDVLDHVKRLEKYRRYYNARNRTLDEQHFIGAVAGAVVKPNVAEFAQKEGLYVIVQSGEAVEILPSPDGFVAKQW